MNNGKSGALPKVIFLGPVPPPYMGPTLATEVLLGSELADNFELIHLDTSDHRPLDTLGAVDFTNIYLALKSYVQLVWLIIRHWPDLVYIPVAQTTLGYLKDSGYILLARLFGRKTMCHLRGGNFRNWYESAKPLTQAYVRFAHGLVNGQIVLGESLRKLFSGLVPEDRIYVVPNGRDYTYQGQSRDDDEIRILFVANFMLTKGVYDVVQAAPLVTNQYDNVKFLFAGAWIEPDLKKQVDAYLEQNPGLPIEFKGIVSGDAKYELLASSDIFVFPSFYPPEGHPWVVVEAMAAGLPIISTDQGAICESVIDGKNGLIIEKQNPQAVADALLKLLGDKDLRDQYSEMSRQLYAENFTENKVVSRMIAAFNSVIGRAA